MEMEGMENELKHGREVKRVCDESSVDLIHLKMI